MMNATWAGLRAGSCVMGIINVTPDSFSDGGWHFDPAAAIAAGLKMVQDGAAILDIGGESTRPGALPLDPATEQARILPVIAGLRDAGAPLSVDTRNAATMAAALDAGAAIINDVSALTHDPDAAALVAQRGCPVILMHMRGTPETMNALAQYDDVGTEVARELAAHVARAEPGFRLRQGRPAECRAAAGSRPFCGVRRSRGGGRLAQTLHQCVKRGG
jgi:dihydropteroate synthase